MFVIHLPTTTIGHFVSVKEKWLADNGRRRPVNSADLRRLFGIEGMQAFRVHPTQEAQVSTQIILRSPSILERSQVLHFG